MDDSGGSDVHLPVMASQQAPNRFARARRKRLSLHRLSTETTTSLPEYTKSPPPKTPFPIEELPPHYSSEEDDPPTLSNANHKHTIRRRPLPKRRRSYSPVDSYLDSLLERSVHALELSNALLQSSLVSQPTPSSTAADQMIDHSLDQHAHLLSRRIQGTKHVHESWMDEMDKVLRGVEELFDDESQPGLPRSVPITLASRRGTRDLALDDVDDHRLRLDTCSRPTSRPPRALTQYVHIESALGNALDASADDKSILMPSTLGLRSAAHISDFRASVDIPSRPIARSRPHQSASISDLRSLHQPVASSGKASRQHKSAPSTSSSSSFTPRDPPTLLQPPPISTYDSWRSTGSHHGRFSVDQVVFEEDEESVPVAAESIPTRPVPFRPRAHIPEPLLPSTSSKPRPVRHLDLPSPPTSFLSSSAPPYQTSYFKSAANLRRILDRTSTVDLKGKGRENPPRVRQTPSHRLISPPTRASPSTSTATASISHLLALSSLESPNRPSSLPPTPKMSNLKRSPSSSLPGTPAMSGRSTPRSVSFATEPTKYSVERGPNLIGRSVVETRKPKKRRSSQSRNTEPTSWWAWLTESASGDHLSPTRRDEDRLPRPLYGRSMDEWMI